MKHLLLLTSNPDLHGLAEDYVGDQADCVLRHWAALWHPSLIDLCQSTPGWRSADVSVEHLSDAVISVPPAVTSRSESAARCFEAAQKHRMVCIHGRDSRLQLAEKALDQLPGDRQLNHDPSIVEDFFALGYWYLQIELLTQRMHYTSNLDKTAFEKQLLLAAQAAVSGDSVAARQHLQGCFGALSEVRDHYYPVDVFLLHFVLTTDDCSTASIREELNWSTASNLMISPDELHRRALDDTQWIGGLRQLIEEERVSLVGCDTAGKSFLEFDCQAQLAAIEKGIEIYEKHLGQRPNVFGRYDLALSSRLPDLLNKTGYQACLHWALDDSRFPETSQSRFMWRGDGGSTIDALGGKPLDAASPEVFLQLARHLGKAMESDYVATVSLVNWSGHGSVWLDDLRRGAAYSRALGEFSTMGDYFQRTDPYGQSEQFAADQYGRPRLWPASQPNQTVSSRVGDWKSRVAQLSASHLSFFARCLARDREETSVTDVSLDLESAGDHFARVIAEDSTVQRQGSLLREPRVKGSLVINPFGFPRRVNLRLNHPIAANTASQALYAYENHEDGATVIVDVPSAGFAWLPATDSSVGRPARSSKHLVDELTLRNEFLQLTVDPETGGIRSIRDYQSRGNCLSQQVAGNPVSDHATQGNEVWRVKADFVRVTVDSELCGEVTAKGQLIDQQGQPIAGFEQRTRLWRGARVIEVEIDICPITEPAKEFIPGNFVARFAWANETAELYRGAIMTRAAVERRLIDSPLYLEIDDGMNRIALLAGGLNLHRRLGRRMVETLLSSHPRSTESFRLGIGVNLKQPLHDALSMCGALPLVRETTEPPQTDGWLFAFSTRRVTATSWELDREPLGTEEHLVGFRLRVLESSGRGGTIVLRAFRQIQSACKIGFGGKVLAECEVREGEVHFHMAANEWTELHCRW
jgi:alpha-mannosidase